jgi:flagellar assembly protein FliH
MQPQFNAFWDRKKRSKNDPFDKFLFEHSFDEAPPEEILAIEDAPLLSEVVEEKLEESPPPPPPPPLFTEEEKQQAYESGSATGHDAGYQQGLQEMKTSLNSQTTQHLEKIDLFLEQAVSSAQERKRELTYQVLVFSKHIFHTLFPLFESKWGADQVEKLVEKVLQNEKPVALCIRLHPQTKEAIQAHVAKWSEASTIQLEADETLRLSDCQLAWDQSGLERNLGKMIQEIEDLFKSFESILKESGQASPET